MIRDIVMAVVFLFISLSLFLHLDCVSQRTCPNLLMASNDGFTHAVCLVVSLRADGKKQREAATACVCRC